MFIDPESSISGFRLLQAIAMRFQDFELVLFEFVSLTVVGLILAYARYATSSLWLPIGLHSGWIFAYTFYGRIARRTPDLEDNLQYLIGSDLKEGVAPLATLAITAFLVFPLHPHVPQTFRGGSREGLGLRSGPVMKTCRATGRVPDNPSPPESKDRDRNHLHRRSRSWILHPLP